MREDYDYNELWEKRYGKNPFSQKFNKDWFFTKMDVPFEHFSDYFKVDLWNKGVGHPIYMNDKYLKQSMNKLKNKEKKLKKKVK